ncbi:hypothetical protein MCEGKSE7_00735 [Candidatus Nanopelagicaceae bacterium]
MTKAVRDLNLIEQDLVDLNNGVLTVTGRLVDASNATLYAMCSVKDVNGDREFACIYKPIAGERPLWDFPDGSLANREYLSFLISHWLELHLVPPTILRDGPYGTGMVQKWIDIDPTVDLMDFYLTDNPKLRELALFDLITNNTDRKIGHLIPTQDGHLYGCDHGVTFHEDDKLRTVLWQWAGVAYTENEKSLLLQARAIFFGEKLEIISSLITEEEINATVARIDRALLEGSFILPSPDWPAVPWPPF